eukprot:2572635-Pyramimonas_sp.AAC.1
MGASLCLPFTRSQAWPYDLDTLRRCGYTIVCMALTTKSVALAEVSISTGKVAIVLGAEGPGITQGALDMCDVVAQIPIVQGVDSLNVGVAGALALAHFASL